MHPHPSKQSCSREQGPSGHVLPERDKERGREREGGVGRGSVEGRAILESPRDTDYGHQRGSDNTPLATQYPAHAFAALLTLAATSSAVSLTNGWLSSTSHAKRLDGVLWSKPERKCLKVALMSSGYLTGSWHGWAKQDRKKESKEKIN